VTRKGEGKRDLHRRLHVTLWGGDLAGGPGPARGEKLPGNSEKISIVCASAPGDGRGKRGKVHSGVSGSYGPRRSRSIAEVGWVEGAPVDAAWGGDQRKPGAVFRHGKKGPFKFREFKKGRGAVLRQKERVNFGAETEGPGKRKIRGENRKALRRVGTRLRLIGSSR